MKQFILFILICNFSIFYSYAYDIKTNDSTSDSLIDHKIKNYLIEKNYTRIPNNDFDEIIENKVVSKINEKFTFWITLIGVFLGAIAGLAAYAFNNKIKQLVLEHTKSNAEKEYQKINEYIKESRKYILRSDLEILKNKFLINRSSEASVSDARNLLIKIQELKNPDLLSEIVDLMSFMYYTLQNPQEIDKIIQTYEKDCEIKETTYMNAAILYCDLYELDGAKWYKQSTLKYCDKAAQKIPYYGEPKGIMLVIYGIDYSNSTDPKERNEALTKAIDLINEILKGSSPYTAYNTVLRIKKDKPNQAFGKYIIKLEQAIPDHFEKLYKAAKSYEERYINVSIS